MAKTESHILAALRLGEKTGYDIRKWIIENKGEHLLLGKIYKYVRTMGNSGKIKTVMRGDRKFYKLINR